MAPESANTTIPSGIIMLFGYLVAVGKFNFWLAVIAGGVGNLLGLWFLILLVILAVGLLF